MKVDICLLGEPETLTLTVDKNDLRRIDQLEFLHCVNIHGRMVMVRVNQIQLIVEHKFQ